MDRVKRIWYLSPMRAAKVQASLRIRAVSPEPSLLEHTSSESRGTFRQKARSLAPLNVWACAVKNCHDGMLEDTNSLDVAQISNSDTCQDHNPTREWRNFTPNNSNLELCQYQSIRKFWVKSSFSLFFFNSVINWWKIIVNEILTSIKDHNSSI